MNFNLVFTALTTLLFSVKFRINSEARQDFFIFKGVNQSANLFREEEILKLYLTQNEGYELHSCMLQSPNFTFSWSGYMVDDEKMKVQDSVGSINKLFYDEFTFISPIIELSTPPFEDDVEPIYSFIGINYWYIVLIVLVIGVLFEMKTSGFEIFKKLIFLLKHDPISQSDVEINE